MSFCETAGTSPTLSPPSEQSVSRKSEIPYPALQRAVRCIVPQLLCLMSRHEHVRPQLALELLRHDTDITVVYANRTTDQRLRQLMRC